MFVYSLSGLELDGSGGSIEVEVEDNEITARTAVYQELGRLFLEPDDGYWEIASDGRWSKEILAAGRLLAFPFDPGDQPEPESLDALRREHHECFDDRARSGAWATDETANRDEIVRFYEYFGLRASENGRPLDHLVTQCDFMQYVTYKEASATSDRLRASYRRAQHDFLERQLGAWLPAFADDVVAKDASPFVCWAAQTARAFVDADRANLGTELAASR